MEGGEREEAWREERGMEGGRGMEEKERDGGRKRDGRREEGGGGSGE